MKIEQIIQSQTSGQVDQVERIQPATNDMVRESKEISNTVFVFEQKASKVTRTRARQKGLLHRHWHGESSVPEKRRSRAVPGSP